MPVTRRRLVALLSLAAGAFAPAAPPITVTEVVEQGQPSYRVATPGATWVYHREGGAFSSLIDPAGNDWISYQPQGGAAGSFRGIPNAVHRRNQEGNNFFHPGHAGPKGSETTLVSSKPDRVVLRSQSRDGRWTCEWEILPDRANLRMVQVPSDDGGYWFLYEGTPGGRLDQTDLCLRAGGTVTPLSETWEASMKDVPWVAFISRPHGSALLLIAHTPSDARVYYRPMQDAMTVFGFGRQSRNLDSLLRGQMNFTVMLLAETDAARIAKAAAAVSRL